MIRTRTRSFRRGCKITCIWAGLAACHNAAPSTSGSAPGTASGRRPLEFAVETERVTVEPAPFVITAVGSVEAFEIVEATARIAGVIEPFTFREGDTVAAGKKLVEIDPRRFQLALQSAEARLERARVQREQAETALVRREAANEKSPGLVREDELSDARAKRDIARADELEAKAARDLARVNLADSVIRAPVSGRIESRLVRTGQYVQPGALVATIVAREPILLRFFVTETEAAHVARDQLIEFGLQGREGRTRARILHVADVAERNSRMVAVTAIAEDPKSATIRPGSFAEVRIQSDVPRDVVVVPETAIRPTERGFVAFVVEGSKAKERRLELGLRTGDGRIEVRSGLGTQDALVVRGQEALVDGAPVRIVAPHSSPRAKDPKPESAPSPAHPAPTEQKETRP